MFAYVVEWIIQLFTIPKTHQFVPLLCGCISADIALSVLYTYAIQIAKTASPFYNNNINYYDHLHTLATTEVWALVM